MIHPINYFIVVQRLETKIVKLESITQKIKNI